MDHKTSHAIRQKRIKALTGEAPQRQRPEIGEWGNIAGVATFRPLAIAEKEKEEQLRRVAKPNDADLQASPALPEDGAELPDEADDEHEKVCTLSVPSDAQG